MLSQKCVTYCDLNELNVQWFIICVKYLTAYEKGIIESGGHLGNCDNNKTVGEGEFCRFDIRKIDNNCTKGLDFGYKRGDPCVLIKLNRVRNLD